MPKLAWSSVRGASHRLLGSVVALIEDAQPKYRASADKKVVAGRGVQGLRLAHFAGRNAVGRNTMLVGSVVVGYGSTIGATSIVYGPARIGSYSQLGPAVALYGRDHPTRQMSTYINRALFDGRLARHARFDEVSIGSDVWIGHGAVVLRGVSVGHGAIVGAGTIVTTDVPDYGIVLGNPGRVVRRRFADAVVERLLRLRWWEFTVEELLPLEPLFHLDLVADTGAAIEMLDDALSRFRSAAPTVPVGPGSSVAQSA